MSNEKPVRITVGDVKEVVEATTIQSDTVVSKPVSSVSYTASVSDTSGKGMMYFAGLIGLILVVIAGYFGVINGIVKPDQRADSTTTTISAPGTVPATTGSSTATNTPPVTAPTATTDSNTASSNAPAASNNAPLAANNAPAN
jgi:hypothetical protein